MLYDRPVNTRKAISSLIPGRVRSSLRSMLGLGDDHIEKMIAELQRRLDNLEDRLDDKTWQRSRQRWRTTEPTSNLTWGRDLLGDAFISTVASHNAFGPDKSILEVGPGYGRLFKACEKLGIPFRKYCAIDIAGRNVEYLRSNLHDPRLTIIHGDVELVTLEENCDVVISSLTFKHLFPSFENAIGNVARFVNPGGRFFIDFVEGQRSYFEPDGVTFIRWYTRQELVDILQKVSLELEGFDEVQHDPDHSRLLLIAKKPLA